MLREDDQNENGRKGGGNDEREADVGRRKRDGSEAARDGGGGKGYQPDCRT